MFYSRFLLAGLTSRLSRNKVRIVFGVRQTGKTEPNTPAGRGGAFSSAAASGHSP